MFQSVRDILTTPIGSRTLRRSYGSRLHEHLDAPLDATTVADIVADTAEALSAWEPRLTLTKVLVEAAGSDGYASLTLQGVSNFTGGSVVMEGIVI
nr:GPW/gp25 family protein [Kordiimonas marina]